MKRKKRFALVEAWRESGQTIKAFRADKEVRPATFNYWRQKYRQENSPFTEVNPQTPGSSHPVEFIYPSGVRICLQQAAAHLIRQLAQ